MNFIPLLLITVALHAGATFTDLWLANLTNPDTPQYGNAAFLPTGGADSSHPYNRAVNFLMSRDDNGNITTISGPDNTGFFSFLQWAVKTPVCGTVSVISLLLGYATFSYDSVDILPNEGWGFWIKSLIYLIGAGMTISVIFIILDFVVKSGILQSTPMMIALAVVGGFAVAFTGLTAGGLVDCAQTSPGLAY